VAPMCAESCMELVATGVLARRGLKDATCMSAAPGAGTFIEPTIPGLTARTVGVVA